MNEEICCIRPWQNDFLFREHTINLSCLIDFMYPKNIDGGIFCVLKCPHINLGFFKIRKIPNLVDCHSLHQLLHSQVYLNGLKVLFLTLKFLLIDDQESNRKIPNCHSE